MNVREMVIFAQKKAKKMYFQKILCIDSKQQTKPCRWVRQQTYLLKNGFSDWRLKYNIKFKPRVCQEGQKFANSFFAGSSKLLIKSAKTKKK